MSGGYTKLFSDIVDSSIWNEDAPTCKVWVTLLALSNADGYVRGSVGWLSSKARVTPEQCQTAIEKFSGPDPSSRTPDNDGRRIEILEDGWLILNYLTFRDRLSNDPKACAVRERVRKHRQKHYALRNASSVTCVTPASASVSVTDSSSINGSDMTVFLKLKSDLVVLYKRTDDRLTYEEERSLLEVSKRPKAAEELEELKAFKEREEFFPQSLCALLSGWSTALDRSRNKPVPVKPKSIHEQQLESIKNL